MARTVCNGNRYIWCNTAKDGTGTDYMPLVSADGRLSVDINSGSSSNTEYTEGDTDASITGIACLGEGAANTLYTVQLDANKYLKVNISADDAGIGGGTQYTEADTDASITGTAILWEDAGDTLVTVNATKPLPVDLGANNDVTVTSGAITETNSATIAGDTTSIDGKITACNTGAIAGTVTANAGTNLNTSALALETGGNLATIAGDTTSIDGKITACNTGAVVVSSGAITETNSATIAGDTTSIDGKITACNTGAVVISSGAVTETNSGAIKTAVELIDNAISGTEMQVDVVAALPAGNNNIGNVDIVTMPAEDRTPAHTQPTIGNSSTTALAANGSRVAALFVNDSDETIYLKLGVAAVMNQGIRLNANGGNFLMNSIEGTLDTAIVYGICTSGSKTLLVTEWT